MGPSIEWVRTKPWMLATAVACMLVAGLATNCAMAQEETPAADAAAPAEPAADAAATDAPTDPVAELTTQLGNMKVGADTVWVLVTAMLVFFMNLGFACVESGFCRAKNAVNILSKNFIVFAVTTLFFWMLGWGIMFGNGTRLFRQRGSLVCQRSRQQPGHGRRLLRRLQCDQLDRRSAGSEVLLPAGVRRHGGHDCFRRRGRAHQVYFVHRVQRADGDCDLPGRRPLDLGRRLAGQGGLSRFRRLDAGAFDRRLGRTRGRVHAWPAHRQVLSRWQAPGHSRP